MSFIDLIAKRKNIGVYETDGVDQAICTLNEFTETILHYPFVVTPCFVYINLILNITRDITTL
jgi:hypothetical protein